MRAVNYNFNKFLHLKFLKFNVCFHKITSLLLKALCAVDI